MQKIVFGTVIYKQSKHYWGEYINSLKIQSVDEFDLFFVNDDLEKKDLDYLVEMLYKAGFENRFDITQGESKAGVLSDFRVQLLLETYDKGYDLLILGDIDDLFDYKRIENIWFYYKMYPHAMFYYNNLISEEGDLVFKYLPKEIINTTEIEQSNFLGMTNTAISLKHLSKEFILSLYAGCCDVFDWYLYSRILLWGGYGVLVDNTNTFYRVYDNNLAGVQGEEITDVLKEREVKLAHYQKLEMFSKKYSMYKKQLSKIVVDEEFYKTNFYNKNKQGYWWSNIRLEKKDVQL